MIAVPLLCALAPLQDPQPAHFAPLDVFALEWATDPQVSPDGARVVYVRNGFDVMTDATRSDLWLLELDRTPVRHRPLVAGPESVSSPRWSPDGDRLLYVASEGDGGAQVFCRWMDDGATAALTHVSESPGAIAWSPDGGRIAFTMFVPSEPEPLAQMPAKPEGAEWAEAPRVVERLRWRADGQGILPEGYTHVFVLDAEGGAPWQVTHGDFDHGGPIAWLRDAPALVVSANRRADADMEPLDTELYRVAVDASGELEALTERYGPDQEPAVSPDGRWIAYTGFDDAHQGFQVRRLYVIRVAGGEPRVLTAGLDRGVSSPAWLPDGGGILVGYDDHGDGKVARVSLDGAVEVLAERVGGTSIGRPYGGGSFSVGGGGLVAYTSTTDAATPADVWTTDGEIERALTFLNYGLLGRRELGAIEEITVPSAHDELPIQAWIVTPPGFAPAERYPLILEIHGGPFANYGRRFSAEVQLYAAAGYVVVYANPRGSTSYGEAFGNAIHHAYPGHDYDDLMSVVDAVVARGFVDPEEFFVTGGSGGGVLTAWIVGKTDRFRAAVVAKPVIDWASFVLTADAYPYFTRYWFPALPWEDHDAYWRRSPLALVGAISTPTMLLTGEEDHRTPISQSEELYQALKLRGVPTALVRIPGASHGIASRPSRLVAKAAHVLAWFERYRGER
jgi:acylaminoacyl-peptidase